MQYSDLVKRIAGDGADAWKTHYAASAAKQRGEDVIILSVGDPDLDTPRPVIDRADRVHARRRHALHAGRRPRGAARGDRAARMSAEPASRSTRTTSFFLPGRRVRLFAASLCLAGPGDEVLAFEPLYPTYPATIEVSGARMVRVPARPAVGVSPGSRGARGGDHAPLPGDFLRDARTIRAATS